MIYYFVLKIQNNTGSTLTTLDIDYKIWVYNDQGRANSFNFSHSSDNSSWTDVSALYYTSPEAASGSTIWENTTKSTTLSVNITSGSYYYLRWSGADVSGSGSRDEFGLDDIVINGGTGGSTSHSHAYSGSTGSTDPTSSDSSGGAVDWGQKFDLGSHTHTMNHTHTGGNNYPSWHGLIPVKPNNAAAVIPSGICAFFRGSTVPDGWSYFSTAEGKWIQGKSTNGATGGTNTHNHTISLNTGYAGESMKLLYTGTPTASFIYADSTGHRHNLSHTHNTVDNIPPYQDLLFCKKN